VGNIPRPGKERKERQEKRESALEEPESVRDSLPENAIFKRALLASKTGLESSSSSFACARLSYFLKGATRKRGKTRERRTLSIIHGHRTRAPDDDDVLGWRREEERGALLGVRLTFVFPPRRNVCGRPNCTVITSRGFRGIHYVSRDGDRGKMKEKRERERYFPRQFLR